MHSHAKCKGGTGNARCKVAQQGIVQGVQGVAMWFGSHNLATLHFEMYATAVNFSNEPQHYLVGVREGDGIALFTTLFSTPHTAVANVTCFPSTHAVLRGLLTLW